MGLPVVIADGDGEAAVVSSDDLNVLVALLALDHQLLALTGVASPDGGARELAWKKKLFLFLVWTHFIYHIF